MSLGRQRDTVQEEREGRRMTSEASDGVMDDRRTFAFSLS